MSYLHSRRRCPQCKTFVLATQLAASHLLHLIVSIATFGMWLIVWPIIAWNLRITPWLCPRCGARTLAADPTEAKAHAER